MSKAGRKRNQAKAASPQADLKEGTVAELVASRGFTIKKSSRSGNKFLGTEQPRSKINPNGYDPVERAVQMANLAAASQLQEVMNRHGSQPTND